MKRGIREGEREMEREIEKWKGERGGREVEKWKWEREERGEVERRESVCVTVGLRGGVCGVCECVCVRECVGCACVYHFSKSPPRCQPVWSTLPQIASFDNCLGSNSSALPATWEGKIRISDDLITSPSFLYRPSSLQAIAASDTPPHWTTIDILFQIPSITRSLSATARDQQGLRLEWHFWTLDDPISQSVSRKVWTLDQRKNRWIHIRFRGLKYWEVKRKVYGSWYFRLKGIHWDGSPQSDCLLPCLVVFKSY